VRKLASIQCISDITPIPDADLIETAHVNGWTIVIKKDQFKIGDLAVYCEIDSFLPIKEEYEFLRKSSYKKLVDGTEGFRLRTIKLKKQISQGLLLPYTSGEVGDDVTEEMGIIKYDPPLPACLSGVAKGNFPSFIPKTDEERIQNIPHIIQEINHDVFITEKLDGTSFTCYHNNGEFGVCSRNLDLTETEGNTHWQLANSNNLKDTLPALGNLAIQGEIIGHGIQQNQYKINGHELRIFKIFDIDKQEYVYPVRLLELCSILKLETVPLLYKGICPFTDLDQALEYAKGKSILNDTKREGVVVIHEFGSFKIINNDWLLSVED
jgi:RNA ligase (TIGR02306 family)